MRYEVTTLLTPEEALARALTHFGPGGMGLAVTTRTHRSMMFQGGGGYVMITVQPEVETTLELETREWDHAVQQFMAQVSGRRRWWHRLLRRKRQPPASPPSFTILNNGKNTHHMR
jgi:hypothetical protein